MPLDYTHGNRTAKCIIHGSVVVGPQILVAAGRFPGESNVGDTVDTLVSHACQDAVHAMVENYLAQ